MVPQCAVRRLPCVCHPIRRVTLHGTVVVRRAVALWRRFLPPMSACRRLSSPRRRHRRRDRSGDVQHSRLSLTPHRLLLPVTGESIPIRLFLGGFDALTPTFRNVNNKFSVKYFLNLVLIDEEDRRYFKQQEVFLYRKAV